MKKYFFLLLVYWCITSCDTPLHNDINKQTVSDFDIEKYLGHWYEIARYDNRFERDMVGVSANYKWIADGNIQVINKGYKMHLDGKEKVAIGKARIPNKKEPSKLQVSFFGPFYSDYLVLELDKAYQWAVVGSKSNKYLWILSRTPQINNNTYQSILSRIDQRGYNTKKLIKVPQIKENGKQ